MTETIYGNLQGLKPSQRKQIERLYHQRLPGDRFTTPEFAQRLGSVSAEIGQPLSAYINRRGQVIRVGVGTPRQTQIPPLELPRYGAERLCGIRCLTTELQDRSPSKGSLTAMVIQRLDALVVLEVSSQGFQKRGGGSTGYVQSTYLAHLMPDPQNPWHLSESTNLDQLVEQDFLDFVQGLEEEFQRQVRARQVDSNQDQVLIVGLQTQVMAGPRFEENLGELQRLVESAGGKV
ncbi:MAG: GTPase HflX, partial [Prochlorotrichaceae cyanobacterium]